MIDDYKAMIALYERMIEDEEERLAHPCCANCKYYYTEYGYEGCKYWGDPKENTNTNKCSHWE